MEQKQMYPKSMWVWFLFKINIGNWLQQIQQQHLQESCSQKCEEVDWKNKEEKKDRDQVSHQNEEKIIL